MVKKWLAEQASLHTARDNALLIRAADCLCKNKMVAPVGEFLSGQTVIVPSKQTYHGVWNWDSAFIALAVSHWDVNLALSQIKIFFENQDKTGMFPDVLYLNGTAITRTSKPPVFAWVLHEIAKRNVDFDIRYFYDKLVKNEKFWCYHRKAGDLFHYDAFTRNEGYEGYERDCRNESGWDNSVRWDTGAENLWAVDLNCYMVLFYRAMTYFAEHLNENDDAKLWRAKEKVLAEQIEKILWDEERGFYCDYDFDEEKSTGILSPAGFMPLFSGIATKQHAECCYAKVKDKKYFYPYIPTVSYNDKKYSPEDFWRGPTWLNTWYFVVMGLNNYGYSDMATELKEILLSTCDREKEDIYEYYNSVTGEGLGAAQFSWSAVFIIETILNSTC